jgi:sulfur carrier protein
MRLQVNGEEREFPPLAHAAQLVDALDLEPSTVLLEHNGLALLRGEWEATPLADGDRIEILRIAAGG